MPRQLDDFRYSFGRMRRGFFTPLLCLVAVTTSLPAVAQQRLGGGTSDAASTAPQTDDQRKAQEHFQRAKELYQAGKYSETIAELEVARGLDPKAKDLVMNLGIVHEKLGKYDEAIGYLRSYLEMEGVTAAERTKVEGMIKRIEGAKSAAPAPATTPVPPVAAAPTVTAPPVTAEPPPAKGRLDGLTIGAGAIAAVGLTVGTSLGIYALASRPGDGFVTGRDGSYATLQDKTDSAHTAAVVADVSLGVGVVAAIATAFLYFGRTKTPAAAPSTGSARLSVTSMPGKASGAFLFGGTF